MPEKERKKPTGRPPKHGAFSIMIARGELPENRKYIQRYLREAREGLISDLGGREQNLTQAQLILIDRVIAKLGIIRCIEEHCRETGVFQEGKLAHVLRDNYLSYTNSLRLDLQALGIEEKKTEEIINLGRYIEEKYQAKEGSQAGGISGRRDLREEEENE